MALKKHDDQALGPRVFISSVMEGYADFRNAAAEGVEAAGAEPVMVERIPSLARSPRNACLDGVQSSDAYLVLVGERGGQITPSGALAVEEEFEEARKRSLPVLVFLQQTERDKQAEELAKKLSDYVSGHFRKTFADPPDLRAKVTDAVRTLMTDVRLPKSDPNRVRALLEADEPQSHEASVRLALVPERADELIGPDRIDSAALVDEIYAIGHHSEIRFFDYSCAKSKELSRNGRLVVSQRAHQGRARLGACLRLSEAGELVLEADITGLDDSRDSGLAHMVIVEGDLVAVLRSEFGFAARLFDHLDPHQRFATLWAGAAILRAEYRHLVPDRPTGHSGSVRMGDNLPVLAEKAPRQLSRAALTSPEPEIQRLVALFRRHLGEGRSGR